MRRQSVLLPCLRPPWPAPALLPRITSTAPAGVYESNPELWGRSSRKGASEKVAVGESLWREELLHHAADLGGRAGRARAHGALQGINAGRARGSDPAARPAGVSAFGSFIKGNLDTNCRARLEGAQQLANKCQHPGELVQEVGQPAASVCARFRATPLSAPSLTSFWDLFGPRRRPARRRHRR